MSVWIVFVAEKIDRVYATRELADARIVALADSVWKVYGVVVEYTVREK